MLMGWLGVSDQYFLSRCNARAHLLVLFKPNKVKVYLENFPFLLLNETVLAQVSF